MVDDRTPTSGGTHSAEVVDVYVDFVGKQATGAPIDIEGCCRQHPELATNLRALHFQFERIAALVESPNRASSTPAHRSSGAAPAEAMAGRLVVHEELGRGGMGVVLRVWDSNLDRALAMKLIRPDDNPGSDQSRRLARFLSEAKVTSQLDHPGIVPVHELGRDERGNPYFTMKLVKGVELGTLIGRMHAGDQEWTLPRLLDVLVRVCEAVSYAHEKRVIHRDLKPANLMVGQFGEAYVMDWGLARVLGEPERVDLRFEASAGGHPASPAREDADEEPLVTQEGDVLGTASYMPPEQARGLISEMGPTADIYSLGAILYHLLTGYPPYRSAEDHPGQHGVLQAVIAGPPVPVHQLKTAVAPELQSICERAMQRRASDRYAGVVDMARDLRAYLEGRVVSAHETGALAEFRKWVERNRAFAISAGLAILLAFAAVTGLTLQANRHNATLNDKNQAIREEKDNVESLLDPHILGTLVLEADGMWPISSALVPRCEDWLRRADELVARLPSHEQRLAALPPGARAAGRQPVVIERESWGPSSEAEEVQRQLARAALDRDRATPAQREAIDRSIAELRARAELLTGEYRPIPLFDRATWQPEQLGQLVNALRDFQGPNGVVASVWLRLVESRAVRVETVEACTQLWADAARSIADPADCPAYEGLAIAPQEGLIPLGRDGTTGLWEFLAVGTGAPPERDSISRRLIVGENTGVVLVLVPGGPFRMGAVREGDSNLDAAATPLWGPVHELNLDPFFIGKHELTQGQWRRLGGFDSSAISSGMLGSSADCHPVERVSWLECVEVLRHRQLCLPTEAQWEYAARAGSSTRWWFGDDECALVRNGNVADQALRVGGGDVSWQYHDWDDGAAEHAVVDAYEPNPFGLYGIAGNVAEWCLDGCDRETVEPGLLAYELPVEPGSGLRRLVSTFKRVIRGGAWQLVAAYSSSAARAFRFPEFRNVYLGLRAARPLERD